MLKTLVRSRLTAAFLCLLSVGLLNAAPAAAVTNFATDASNFSASLIATGVISVIVGIIVALVVSFFQRGAPILLKAGEVLIASSLTFIIVASATNWGQEQGAIANTVMQGTFGTIPGANLGAGTSTLSFETLESLTR